MKNDAILCDLTSDLLASDIIILPTRRSLILTMFMCEIEPGSKSSIFPSYFRSDNSLFISPENSGFIYIFILQSAVILNIYSLYVPGVTGKNVIF